MTHDLSANDAKVNTGARCCIDYLESAYGTDLDIFGATQSAHDPAAFIEATHEDGLKVFLWGNSSGTHWALRFLQLFPDGHVAPL